MLLFFTKTAVAVWPRLIARVETAESQTQHSYSGTVPIPPCRTFPIHSPATPGRWTLWLACPKAQQIKVLRNLLRHGSS